MDELLERAQVLAADIQKSQFYRDYFAAKNVIESDSALRAALFDYQSLNKALVLRKLEGGTVTLDEAKDLSNRYWELYLKPAFKTYFDAETALTEWLDGVYRAVDAVNPFEEEMQ